MFFITHFVLHVYLAAEKKQPKIVLSSRVQLRSISQTMGFLIEDLRIDEEQLQALDAQSIQSWVKEAPKRNSLQMLVNTLQRL